MGARCIIFSPFPLLVSVYVYASVRDFLCIALLSPFALGFCPSVIFFLFFSFFLNNNFFILITLFYCILLYFMLSSFFFFFLFFLPFILSHVGERFLMLQTGIRAVPLRWESQLQDTGPQETSQLDVIPNDENLPEISISTPRPSFTQRPASYSAGHPMPNN